MNTFPSKPVDPLASRVWRRSAMGLSLIGLLLSGMAQAADLSVRVNNLRNDEGFVNIGLFDTEASFPKTIRLGQRLPARSRAADGSLLLVFTDLPPGRYAVSVFHDSDGNGVLNANLMGIPSEPYGFSNNAKSSFGPPAFQDAAFELTPQGAQITIELR